MNQEPKCRYISLGAGVQSSVMALMSDRGQLGERPDFAIFADTGWEPPHIYEHLEWLRGELSYPVHLVGEKPTLRESVRRVESFDGVKGHIEIPVFLKGATRSDDGIGGRHCTGRWKVRPIRRKLRELLGLPTKGTVGFHVEQQMGISTDEAHRMKDSDVRWIVNRYPLADAGLSRRDCLAWWHLHYPGRQLRKSACVGCPYQSPARWLALSRENPKIFRELVEIDEGFRQQSVSYQKPAYLHSTRRPLGEAVALSESQQQMDMGVSDQDGFGNECGGHCGV